MCFIETLVFELENPTLPQFHISKLVNSIWSFSINLPDYSCFGLSICCGFFFRFSSSVYPMERICRQLVNTFFKKLLKGSFLNWASQHWCVYSDQVLWSWLGLPELSSVRWSFLSQICWDVYICLSWVIPSISRGLFTPVKHRRVVTWIGKCLTPSWLDPRERVSIGTLLVTRERDFALKDESEEELNPLFPQLILLTI